MDSPKKEVSPERLREVALARRLGEALDRLSPSGGECLDPERIAAYHTRALKAAEAAECESHFSTCSRCRRILAVLAAPDDVPLAEGEVAHLGKLAANVETGGLPSAPPARPRWFADWRRWLAPALAAAAVATVWVVLRAPWQQQRSAPVMVAAEQKSAGGPPSAATARPAPVPPAVSRRDNAVQEDRLKANRAAPEASTAQAQLESSGAPAFTAKARKTAPAARARGVFGGAPREDLAIQGRAPATRQGKAAQAKPSQAGGVPSASAKNELALPQALTANAPGVVIQSPSGRVLWRAGSAGSIEQSTNTGRTWRQQMSPAREDWLAGAAASDTVCWLAGRDGAIARTTDGTHWERIAPPGGAAGPSGKFPDWVAVTADSAQAATVTTVGNRRFSTRDGGKTWQAQ